MTQRQEKLLTEKFIRPMVKRMLKENSNKDVLWFKTSAGKATGMIQLTISEDSLGEKMINLSSQNAGLHINEVDELINSLNKMKKLL